MKTIPLKLLIVIAVAIFIGSSSFTMALDRETDPKVPASQFREKLDEATGKKELLGPKVKIPQSGKYSHARLKGSINKEGHSSVQVVIVDHASSIYGFTNYHTATTMEGDALKFLPIERRVDTKNGFDAPPPAGSSLTENLFEKFEVALPPEYLRQKTKTGFEIRIKGKGDAITVSFGSAYVVEFLLKFELFIS